MLSVGRLVQVVCHSLIYCRTLNRGQMLTIMIRIRGRTPRLRVGGVQVKTTYDVSVVLCRVDYARRVHECEGYDSRCDAVSQKGSHEGSEGLMEISTAGKDRSEEHTSELQSQ